MTAAGQRLAHGGEERGGEGVSGSSKIHFEPRDPSSIPAVV
jgi:hypothetical protein